MRLIRQRLADHVLHADWCHEADRHPDFLCACEGYRDEIAAALEQTVRDLIADELDVAAGELWNDQPAQVPAAQLADRARGRHAIRTRATAVRARTEETT